MQKFSVCMSVYKNDDPTNFKTAVLSVWVQTVQPDEIVLVIDGPVPDETTKVIEELRKEIPVLHVIPLPQNMGHAIARQTGLDAARNELVAVMDADDISVFDRFEKQLKAFDAHPDVSVVGGLINEFIISPKQHLSTRFVPEADKEIKKYMKSRAPMNLVTVMLKKSDVMKVGGYLDWYCEEDTYLWARLALAGYKFYNLQENLVNVRVGDEMYQRRGGWRYFKSEALMQGYMFRNGIISLPRFLYNVAIRLAVQLLMPNKVRGWVFRHFARK